MTALATVSNGIHPQPQLPWARVCSRRCSSIGVELRGGRSPLTFAVGAYLSIRHPRAPSLRRIIPGWWTSPCSTTPPVHGQRTTRSLPRAMRTRPAKLALRPPDFRSHRPAHLTPPPASPTTSSFRSADVGPRSPSPGSLYASRPHRRRRIVCLIGVCVNSSNPLLAARRPLAALAASSSPTQPSPQRLGPATSCSRHSPSSSTTRPAAPRTAPPNDHSDYGATN